MERGSGSAQARDLVAAYAPEPNALERRALTYLGDDPEEGRVPIDRRTRAALERLQWRTVLVGALSGALSGLFLGAMEMGLTHGVIGDANHGVLDDPLEWSLFYAAVGIVTVAEILFLYRVTLRASARLKALVGVPAEPEGVPDVLRTALARAALESDNPRRTIFGIDPHAFVPRWQLVLRSLAYRAKVGVSSFLLRIVARRLLVRAALRAYLPLLAAPLYAAWNAIVLHRILEEARLRIFGPFAVRAILRATEGEDEGWRRAAIEGATALVRRSADAHPNYVILLDGLKDFGILDREERGDLERLRNAPRARRERLAGVLSAVAILAGRPRSDQLRYLRTAHERMGLGFDAERLVAMRRQLRAGEAIELDR